MGGSKGILMEHKRTLDAALEKIYEVSALHHRSKGPTPTCHKAKSVCNQFWTHLHFCTRFELMTMCVSFVSWGIARVFCDSGWEPRPGSTASCWIWLCLPSADGVQMGFLLLAAPSQPCSFWTSNSSRTAGQLVLNWEARDGWCIIMAKLEMDLTAMSFKGWKGGVNRKWQTATDFTLRDEITLAVIIQWTTFWYTAFVK